jgi:hypothetical protein
LLAFISRAALQHNAPAQPFQAFFVAVQQKKISPLRRWVRAGGARRRDGTARGVNGWNAAGPKAGQFKQEDIP